MAKNLIEDFINAIKTDDTKKRKDNTYSAEVAKVDTDGTVWVNVAGSTKSTPTASTSTEVTQGDKVKVEWRNNKLYIAGNTTNPSAGVETVAKVERKANEAQSTATSAQSIAESASKIAGDTNQYFWHTESGTDTGAHITEIPREEFLADPTNGGGNLLARSNGIAIRDGLTELATFGANGATIGKAAAYHLETTSNGIDFHDGSTNIGHIHYDDSNECMYMRSGDWSGNNRYYSVLELGQGSAVIEADSGTASSLDWASAGFSTDGFGLTLGKNSSYKCNLTLTPSLFAIHGSNLNSPMAKIVPSTGKLTLEGHSSPVGTVLTTSATSSRASGTDLGYLTGVYLDLPAGSWIITLEVRGNLASAGKRLGFDIYDSTNATEYYGTRIVLHTSHESYIGGQTTLVISTSGARFNARCYQNSGSSVDLSGYMRAMRIS